MKRLFLIMLTVCGFVTSANAQYYNETLLFIEVGKTIDNAQDVIYLHFDSDGNMYAKSLYKNTAQDYYAKGILNEYGVNESHKAKRDYSIDTSKYYVYKEEDRYYYSYVNWATLQEIHASQLRGHYYYAIEYGSGGLVKWYVADKSSDVRQKKYYKRIQPSDLARKAPDLDFLK